MKRDNYIVTNFAYGTGPYLRTTELAIAVNNFLEQHGHDRCRIIVPLVYGDKQKRIMEEEFKDFYRSNPNEIVFDKQLGSYLRRIFYGSESYEKYLKRWILSVDGVSNDINRHLRKTYKDRIVLELHRSPRVLYDIAPSYLVSFAYISEIFKNAVGNEEIATGDDLLKQAFPKIEHIEKSHRINFITEPGTFSYKKDPKRHFSNEVRIPPTISFPKENKDSFIERGLFITVTGIPGLERLYSQAVKLGLRVYSNDIRAIPYGEKALPRIITNKNIALQFARSGWSSVWLSQLSGTPILVPDWDRHDDPEIYFNNICVKKLGLGMVYKGQSLEEILEEAELVGPKIESYNKGLYQKFSTLDGTRYAAERIVKDFISID